MNLSLVIDLAIIVTFLLYVVDGYRRGFLLLLLEFFGIFLTFYLGWLGSDAVAILIERFFDIPGGLEKVVGFIVLWLLLQAVYVGVSSFFYPRIPALIRNSLPNKLAGVLPSMAKGLVMTAVVSTVLVVLPVHNQLRPAILGSQLGKPLVTQTQKLQQHFSKQYSQELTETLTFLTTSPIVRKPTDPSESIPLHFKTTDVQPDPKTEAAMLRLVNEERAKLGLDALVADTSLRNVARAHARDMLARGYFSHYTPEGDDPFDRIQDAGIVYLTAGENLAFAPTLELAHIGLMNSPKHRDNILYPDFGKLGVGVIDAGFYGKMFVQVFSN